MTSVEQPAVQPREESAGEADLLMDGTPASTLPRRALRVKPDKPPAEPASPKLPPPPGRTLTIDQLLTYWRSVPDASKARLSGYLYRLWPYIVKSPAYIDKFAAPPDAKEDILRQWGTGEYELKLTDLDKALGRGEVCRARWKFSDSYVDCPPIIESIRETLDMGRKENASYIAWLQTTGKLNMSPQQSSNGSDAAVTALAATLSKLLDNVVNKKPEADSSFTKLIEMFTVANKVSLEMALAQVKENSPEQTLKLITTMQSAFGAKNEGSSMKEMIELFRLMAPAKDDSRDKFMLDELRAAREQNTLLLGRLLDRQERPAEDGMTKRIVDAALSRLLDGDGFSGGGARRSKWGEVIELAGPHIDKGLSALSFFGQGFAAMWAARARQAGAGPIRQPSSAPQPPAAGLPPAEAAPPEQQPDIPAQDDPMRAQLMNFFSAQWPTIAKFIQEDRPGESLADYLMFGGQITPMMLGILRDQVGRDKIMQMIRESEAWPTVEPVAGPFAKLLDGFLAWHEGWDDEEEPPEAGATPIDAGRRP